MIDNDVVKIKLDNDEAIMFTGVDYEDIVNTLQGMSQICKWLIIKNVIINIDRIMYIEKVEKDKEVEQMNAKEMFEELGYRLISGDDKELINYRVDLDTNSFMQVVFNNESKSFWCGRTRNTYFDGYLRKNNSFISIDVKLLKAINKQVEELGWNK